MNKNIKKIILISALILLCARGQAYAAVERATIPGMSAENDFIVEPGKTEIFLNPGETVTKNIVITNRIGKTFKFKLSTEDMVGTNDPNSPIKLMGDEVGPYSLKNFITPEISEFTLNQGEKISIPVNISVPTDAEPRGYYGALIVSNEPEVITDAESKDTQGKARLISRIGSLFLLRINGEGKEAGQLENFKIIGPKQMFYQARPKGFEIAFKNTGNVHLVPHGMVTIKNMIGRRVGEIPVDAYFALPDATRYREVYWSNDKGLAGLGRYTANLSLYKGYGSESDNATASVSFWIIPWKILIITFIGLVVLISIVYYILTRFEIKKK